MKVVLLLACTFSILSSKEVLASAVRAPLEIISLDDITPEERKQLDHLHHTQGRPKRSGGGSGDILDSLKSAIGHGIKKKIGEIAHGSATASAKLSSSSSDHGYSYPSYHHHHDHHVPESYDHKSFDFWTLKKSILNTLLQAVKAIKGGVIAVKGQLIKGGGHLISAKGKLISAKGDAITKLGKNIAASAVLVPYHGHSSSGHADYGSSSHYSAPSAPEEIYHGAPSAPGPEYHAPEHYPSHHDDDSTYQGHSGILILKKIPKEKHHHYTPEESEVPEFKPLEPSGPSFGTIVGKFLSASSSLDPHKPELFGHTAPAKTPYHSDSQIYEEESAPVGVSYKNKHKVQPTVSGYVVDDDDEPPKKEKKPSSIGDAPFEQEPTYLSQNFDEHDSKTQTIKANSLTTKFVEKPSKKPVNVLESPKPSTSNQYGFEIPTVAAQSLSSPPSSSSTAFLDNYNLYNLPNIKDYSSGFPGIPTIPQSNGELPASFLDQPSSSTNIFQSGSNLFDQSPSIDLTKSYQQPEMSDISSTNFVGPQSFPKESEFQMSRSKPTPFLQTPKDTYSLHRPFDVAPPMAPPTRLAHFDSMPSSSKSRYKITSPKRPSSSKRPSSTRTTHKRKSKPTYDVVRSVAYELGPNGPKRLT